MEPNAYNVHTILNGSCWELQRSIPRVMELLLQPNTPSIFIEQYAGALDDRWNKDFERGQTGKGRTFLQRACIEAGVIKTFIALAQLPREDIVLPKYNALSAFVPLVKCSTAQERRIIFNQMIENEYFEYACDLVVNAKLTLFRVLGLNQLRLLSADLFLGETLSPKQTAEIFEMTFRFALEGTDRVCQELLDPATTFQSQMMIGRMNVPPAIAAKYGKRYYAMAQEHCVFLTHALLCRSPIPSRQYVLEVLHHRPQILDMLLDLIHEHCPPWCPEAQVDSVACEILTLLVQFPAHTTIPGLSSLPDADIANEYESEYKATIQAIDLVVSRPEWAKKLSDVWANNKKSRSTTFCISNKDLCRLFHRAEKDYHATSPPDLNTMRDVYDYKGTVRVSILRLIASLTHSEKIQNSDLLALLRAAYNGSQKTPDLAPGAGLEDRCHFIEHHQEIYRSPMWSAETNVDVEAPSLIPHAEVMGPIAMIRLLTKMAQRNILEEARQFKKLPEGTPAGTNLRQVKQIVAPDVVKKLVLLSMKRLVARRELGRTRLQRQTDVDLAYVRASYLPAAELAAALIEFDEVTNKRWTKFIRGATRELVMDLGNAAEMCIRRKQYDSAFVFALLADKTGRDAPEGEDLATETIQKNQRRLAEARKMLSVDGNRGRV
ncbi:hypothetical protein C8Q75DRAFT_795269 [Abortiporus biennis]|nr:hypothetical protein C8Q75DRAFT_795269 [Abortiporus biennis]